jgi:hypothetical protein
LGAHNFYKINQIKHLSTLICILWRKVSKQYRTFDWTSFGPPIDGLNFVSTLPCNVQQELSNKLKFIQFHNIWSRLNFVLKVARLYKNVHLAPIPKLEMHTWESWEFLFCTHTHFPFTFQTRVFEPCHALASFLTHFLCLVKGLFKRNYREWVT